MEWLDTFATNLKDFWSQPVPIIGFTVGTCIIGFCFIFAKTSLGKKALNKLQKLYDDLVAKYKEVVKAKNEIEKEYNDFKADKNDEIKTLTNNYELKLNEYKERMVKQDEIIKVLCENSPNAKVKKAYEEYSPVSLDLPLNEVVEGIKEQTRQEYESRIKALEDLIYGKEKETENN